MKTHMVIIKKFLTRRKWSRKLVRSTIGMKTTNKVHLKISRYKVKIQRTLSKTECNINNCILSTMMFPKNSSFQGIVINLFLNKLAMLSLKLNFLKTELSKSEFQAKKYRKLNLELLRCLKRSNLSAMTQSITISQFQDLLNRAKAMRSVKIQS